MVLFFYRWEYREKWQEGWEVIFRFMILFYILNAQKHPIVFSYCWNPAVPEALRFIWIPSLHWLVSSLTPEPAPLILCPFSSVVCFSFQLASFPVWIWQKCNRAAWWCGVMSRSQRIKVKWVFWRGISGAAFSPADDGSCKWTRHLPCFSSLLRGLHAQ